MGACSLIAMASTMEYSRKIFNSPTYAEQCTVQSAKTIMSADNWFACLFRCCETYSAAYKGVLDRQDAR
jgi:hypothetical protein